MNDRKNLASKKRNNDTAAIFWTFTGALPICARNRWTRRLPLFGLQIERRFDALICADSTRQSGLHGPPHSLRRAVLFSAARMDRRRPIQSLDPGAVRV